MPRPSQSLTSVLKIIDKETGISIEFNQIIFEKKKQDVWGGWGWGGLGGKGLSCVCVCVGGGGAGGGYEGCV